MIYHFSSILYLFSSLFSVLITFGIFLALSFVELRAVITPHPPSVVNFRRSLKFLAAQDKNLSKEQYTERTACKESALLISCARFLKNFKIRQKTQKVLSALREKDYGYRLYLCDCLVTAFFLGLVDKD
jgi:hypothetical protein